MRVAVMICPIHGNTCSGEHASPMHPMRISDGKPLISRAHTLTDVAADDYDSNFTLALEFSGIRVGVVLFKGYTPQETIARLHELIDLIESNFPSA